MRRALPALLVAATLALVPATASFAAGSVTQGCTVSTAHLDWGFKESFRAYIDSTIANGEWTEAGGATYEGETFGWDSTHGSLDPRSTTGQVDFAGSIEFTGHGGVLDTTISAPVLLVRSPSDAVLVLDVSGPSMEGDQIDAPGTEFVSIDLTGQNLTPVNGVISIVDAQTALTADGYAAFPDYPAGTAFDPISASLDVGDCDLVGVTIVSTPGWLLPVIGGGAVLVLAGAAVAFIMIRRRRNVSA